MHSLNEYNQVGFEIEFIQIDQELQVLNLDYLVMR